jgi:gluconokinase
MGVSGSGKSAVGQRLADELGVPFLEGDSFHSPANVAKMAAGVPLTDADREGWLQALQAQIRAAREAGHGVVLACSALKRRYRDVLRAGDPALKFAHLSGDHALISVRMQGRTGHYMPVSLLDSQLATLEALQPDEAGIELDIRNPPEQLIARILQ